MKRLSLPVIGICLGILFNNCIAAEEPVNKVQQPSENFSELKASIGQYMDAWQKQDLKTMRTYESWKGGAELDDIKYIQAFNADLNISKWQITRVEPGDDNEYKVLVLISHNPPKQVISFVKKGVQVNSTLIQWWGKQGDKFVHLYNIERSRMQELFSPPKEEAPAVSK